MSNEDIEKVMHNNARVQKFNDKRLSEEQSIWRSCGIEKKTTAVKQYIE